MDRRVHRLGPVSTMKFLFVFWRKAETSVVGPDGVHLTSAGGGGVCRTGSAADASGSRSPQRQSLDHGSRCGDVNLDVINCGGGMVVAMDHATIFDRNLRSPIGNGRTCVAGRSAQGRCGSCGDWWIREEKN